MAATDWRVSQTDAMEFLAQAMEAIDQARASMKDIGMHTGSADRLYSSAEKLLDEVAQLED